jgi:hypothetical protein
MDYGALTVSGFSVQHCCRIGRNSALSRVSVAKGMGRSREDYDLANVTQWAIQQHSQAA